MFPSFLEYITMVSVDVNVQNLIANCETDPFCCTYCCAIFQWGCRICKIQNEMNEKEERRRKEETLDTIMHTDISIT